MTRFMMSLDESVDLVLFALERGVKGDLFVQKSPAAKVETIVAALSRLMNKNQLTVNNIGIRPGEKIHETLLSAEERSLAFEHPKYFQVPKMLKTSLPNTLQTIDYTSENTNQLSVIETVELLKSIPLVTSNL
jgi:UDP-glucose 4-epimerase